MRIRLHEIELFSKDTEASKAFYAGKLGFELNHAEKGLNVFDAGQPGVDFDTSVHLPGKVRVGFVVDDLAAFAETLKAKGVPFEGPEQSHLGMNILRLTDPDGHLVEIQAFTEGTPPQVRQAFPMGT
jgi:catechol 2,3-dioxygenase-like lactoylglutathione lyase family enzyme